MIDDVSEKILVIVNVYIRRTPESYRIYIMILLILTHSKKKFITVFSSNVI